MRQSAYSIYLIIAGVAAFCFSVTFTTSAIYRFEAAGLNPLQLIFVGTTLELAVFLFEIPTGIVADVYSRRLSALIGFALIGCGFLVEGAWPLFATILLAQVIWGVGYTFTSGALDAWLADEIGEARLAGALLRGAQFGQAGSFAGIFVGVWLASFRLSLPYLVGGSGLLVLALYLLIAMPETAFTQVAAEERQTLAGLSTTLRQGMSVIRNSPMLQTMLAVALFYGLSSEGIDRLWEAHLLENFDLPGLGALEPIYWFGIVNGCVMLLTIGSTELLRRRADSLDGRRLALLLAAMTSVLIGGLLIFGLAPVFGIAIGAYVTLAVVRSTMSPLLATWYNRGIPSPVRATVLSTIGQMDAIGQVVGGPPLGAFATRFGLRAMFALIALLLTPVLALYARAISLTERRGKVD